MKKCMLLLLASTFATPAIAQEKMAAPNSPATEMTLEMGWTAGAGGKLVANGVFGKRAYKLTTTVGANETYLVNVQGTRTAGEVEIAVQGVKHGAGGVLQLAPTIAGLAPIPDNWITANGLETEPAVQGEEPDMNGSLRFHCSNVHFRPDDPMLLPGEPGAAHLHMFFCNDGTTANSTQTSLRKTGISTASDPRYPADRTAKWMPAILDGMGNAVAPEKLFTYYKTLPKTMPGCDGPPDATHVGLCVCLPNGLAYIKGYDMATGTNPDLGLAVTYECMSDLNLTSHPTAGGRENTMEAVGAKGCPASAYLFVALQGPDCWNGVAVRTVDNRSHVAYSAASGQFATIPANAITGNVAPQVVSRCPTTHPYMFPTWAQLITFKLDVNFVAGRWRLSSDEQRGLNVPAGTTAHMDYWEAWSPAIKAIWEANCIDEHLSCNNFALGNGQRVKGSLSIGSSKAHYRPRSRTGWTPPITSASFNKTYEVRTVSGGEIAAYGIAGFTGEITRLSVVKIGRSKKVGPIVQTHTGH